MAVRQEDIPRDDLQSSLAIMPAFDNALQGTMEAPQVFENEDGSIDLVFDEYEDEEQPEVHHDKADEKSWNENLAEKLNEGQRRTVASRLIEFLEIDEQARAEHFDRMKEAIRLLGVTNPANSRDSSAPFEGASVVTHPMIAEAVTQFQARAIEELMPATGPVKSSIVGKQDSKRQAQGRRVEEFMNYQLTEMDEEHFWNTDQMLFYLGLSGTAFKKAQQDPVSGMIVSRFVKDHDFIVPYNAKSLASAPRYCHRYPMWENDILRAKEGGQFLKSARMPQANQGVDIGSGANAGRKDFEDKADDRSEASHVDDVVSTILEYHIDFRLPWDEKEDIAPPYIITVDKETEEVLAIRRNWKMEDKRKQRRLWFSMYRYLPGIGFYGMGMLHIIGNLALAAGGAMRALLDAAAFANFQGGFKLKQANLSGEMVLEPGVYKDIDCTIDDISKMFYTPPFKEPSPALAQMLQLMVEEGRRFLSTTENMVGDASNTGPVGTTLALIEQGSKVFSAIHKRMHVSARREYKMLAQLNFEFMPDERYPYEIEGESREVMRQDFDGRVDIIPVSDPNIWSSTQRIAQAQATVELMQGDPNLYGEDQRREAHRRLLTALKVPDVDKILPSKKNMRLDPVAENMNMLVGNAARAFYEQDHEAHMAVHQNFGQKMASTNPDLVAQLEPVMQAHMMEHLAFKYRKEVEAEMGMALPPHDLFEQSEQEEVPPEIEAQLSQAVAKKMSPPPPPPPDPEAEAAAQEEAAAAAQADDAADAMTIAEIERKSAAAGRDLANKQEAFDAEEARKQSAYDAEEMRKDDAAAREAARGNVQAQAGERDAMLSRLSKRRDQESMTKAKVAGQQASQAAKKPATKAKPKPKAKGKS